MILACVDGGLICGPLLAAVVTGLAAWMKLKPETPEKEVKAE